MLAYRDPAERRLTVLQTLPDMHSGGVERGVVEVGDALAAAGHRSIVVSAGGPMVARLEAGGSEHVEMPIGRKSPATLRCVPKLRDLCVREGVDVLHARSRVPAWAALLAWRSCPAALRPRLVTTMHGLHSVGTFSSVMTRGERVIAVSRTVRDHILENYPGCPESRITVIPRGVDPDAMPYGHLPDDGWIDAFLAEFPRLRRRRLVTLAGRLTRLKGHFDFLDVIERSAEDVHGLIVGGEDPKRRAYAEELRGAVRDRGLSGRVTLTGHRPDVREVLAVSDVVVSLSTKPESFGRAVLESLSLGRPVVGYDHGGVGEVLADLFPEGRVPLGDTAAAADRVADLIEHGAVPGPVFGYELDAMLDAVLGVYESMATPARRPVAA